MAENKGKEQMTRLSAAAMNANGITQAAFILLPYDKISDNSENPDDYVSALQTNNWRGLLQRAADWKIHHKNNYTNFANFLSELGRTDIMELLRFGNEEPLFVKICEFKSLSYKILCNKNLIKDDVFELLYMYDKGGQMVFPSLLDKSDYDYTTVKHILENKNLFITDEREPDARMIVIEKIKLFNTENNYGSKSFSRLPSSFQKSEVMAMPTDIAFDFLNSPASTKPDNHQYKIRTFATIDSSDAQIAIMTGIEWSPEQLAELCKASLKSLNHGLFDYNGYFKDEDAIRILQKLPPKLQDEVLLDDRALEHLVYRIENFYPKIVDAGLINGRDLEQLRKLYNTQTKYYEELRNKYDAQKRTAAKELEESFLGNYTLNIHNNLIQSIILNVKKK